MKTASFKKWFVLLAAAFALPGALFARASNEEASTRLTIYGLKGPSGVAMIQLFEKPPEILGYTVTVEALAQADLMAARFISGEAKVGILPPNVAAKIASTGKDIRIAAITGTGMLSLLSSDPAIASLEDLRGRVVEVAGQGSTPDYVFRRLLLAAGLDPDRDLTLSYSLATAEIAQSLIAGRVAVGLIPEPFATLARSGNAGLREVVDVQEEWVRAGGQGSYPMTALVVDGAFADYNPGAMTTILNSLRESVAWTVAHPAEAGALVEKHDLGLTAPVVTAAIPRSAYVFITAREARAALESLFGAFLEFAPASIGGALPADGFYYP